MQNCSGPYTCVVREAIMKGSGDASDSDEFLRIIPTNGCEFHGGYGFGGVTYGRDYVPDLTPYEDAVNYLNMEASRRDNRITPWYRIEVGCRVGT